MFFNFLHPHAIPLATKPSKRQIGNGLFSARSIWSDSLEKYSKIIIDKFCPIRDKALNLSTKTLSQQEIKDLILAIIWDRFTSTHIYFNKLSDVITKIPEWAVEAYRKHHSISEHRMIDSKIRFDIDMCFKGQKFHWLDNLFDDELSLQIELFQSDEKYETPYLKCLDVLKNKDIGVEFFEVYFRDMVIKDIIGNIADIIYNQKRKISVIRYKSPTILKGDTAAFSMQFTNNKDQNNPLGSIADPRTMIMFGLSDKLLISISPEEDCFSVQKVMVNEREACIWDDANLPLGLPSLAESYNLAMACQSSHFLIASNEELAQQYMSLSKDLLLDNSLKQKFTINSLIFDSTMPITVDKKFSFTVDMMANDSIV